MALVRLGAAVELVDTGIAVPDELPARLSARETVRTAFDLQVALERRFPAADGLCMLAAVADYSPVSYVNLKHKKDGSVWAVELAETADIVTGLAARRLPGQALCAVSLEDADYVERAMKKAAAKRVDAVLAVELGADLPFGDGRLRCALVDGTAVLAPSELRRRRRRRSSSPAGSQRGLPRKARRCENGVPHGRLRPRRRFAAQQRRSTVRLAWTTWQPRPARGARGAGARGDRPAHRQQGRHDLHAGGHAPVLPRSLGNDGLVDFFQTMVVYQEGLKQGLKPTQAEINDFIDKQIGQDAYNQYKQLYSERAMRMYLEYTLVYDKYTKWLRDKILREKGITARRTKRTSTLQAAYQGAATAGRRLHQHHLRGDAGRGRRGAQAPGGGRELQ